MSWQSCGAELDPKVSPCLGTPPARRQVPRAGHDEAGRHDAVPACANSAFGCNGAVARTGVILLDDASGSAAKLRRTEGACTLTATARDTCDVEQFGTGTCWSRWTWKARCTPVEQQRRR